MSSGTFTPGHVKLVPPTVTVLPDTNPSAASACAEKLRPPPSYEPADGSLSLLMPVLSYAAVTEPYGTLVDAELSNVPSLDVALNVIGYASGVAPAAGVTCHVAVALLPPGTLAIVTGVVADAVQPDGTVADSVTFETAALPPFVNVALTVDGWPAGTTAGVEFVSVP